MSEEGKFEQQRLVPNDEGGVSIDTEKEEDVSKKKSTYPPLRTNKDSYRVEEKEENLVSFKKETEVYAYSRGLRRYSRYLLKNNINAYIVESSKDVGKGKRRCYRFEENLDEQTNHANLYLRGYSERLDGHFPFFFAYKSLERRPKKGNRLID